MPHTEKQSNDQTSTQPADAAAWKRVRVPGSTDHDGHHLITVTLRWQCPRCNGPRGPVQPVISYDGSRRLGCDGWNNPRGHVDSYRDVRTEAQRQRDMP